MSLILPRPLVLAPRLWRDFRDGSPPPGFHAMIRRGIRSAAEHLIPPLLPEDVVMFLGLWIAGKFLYPLIRDPRGSLSDATGLLDPHGIIEVLAADAAFARQAGFLLCGSSTSSTSR